MNINEPKHGGGFVIPFLTKSRTLTNSSRSTKSNRLPWLSWIPDNTRNHFIAMSGEFAGTTLFLFFAFSGTQVALLSDASSGANEVGAISNPAQLLYIALCFGFSLAVNAWVFFRISGGLFNPAVTMGMCLVGALPYIRGVCLIFSQILGGITAAAICSALFPGPLTVRTSLGGGTSVVQGLFIEMFLTAELVFTIFMLAAEKHKGTFIAPIGIGLSLFIAELTGVYFTGGSVNPARSFGPSVVAHKFHSYHWIYWVGPILGSLLASGFYKFIKMLEYETANPNQDATKPEGEHFNPDLIQDRNKSHVMFVPEDYAERGMIGSSTNDSRPWSSSPSMASPNAAMAGLESGGMHNNELMKPQYQNIEMQNPGSRESNASTLAVGADNPLNRTDASVAQSNGIPTDQNFAPVRASSIVPKKTAMKPGTNNVERSNVSSLSNNTYNNRMSNGGQNFGINGDLLDEEFYDKSDY